MSYKFIFMLVLAALTSPVFSQYNSDSLPLRLEKIDKLFSAFLKPGSPGVAVGIIKGKKFIFERYYGLADISKRVQITSGTRFNIVSNSKQFTAACLLLLEEQGKLSLEDNCLRYIPELKNINKKITIRQLIHHTSGLREHYRTMRLLGLNKGHYTTQHNALKMASISRKLNFNPGEAHNYCNTGYALLALIVERVSGQRFEEFINENIFKPLGMKNTFAIADFKNKPQSIALGYYREDTSSNKYSENKVWKIEMKGSSGIYTTLNDLLIWDNNFYQNTLGKHDTSFTSKMYQPYVLNNGNISDYAAGLYPVDFKGYHAMVHGGDFLGYHSQFWRIPSENCSIISLSNSDESKPWELVKKMMPILFAIPENDSGDFLKQDSIFIHTHFLNKEGVYMDTLLKEYSIVKIEKGKLMVNGLPTHILGADEFYATDYSSSNYKIVKTTDKKYALLVNDDRMQTKMEEPGPNIELKDFVGIYTCDELKSRMKIGIQNDKLFITWKRNKIYVEPFFKDAFNNAYEDKFIFERDAQGKVTGFNHSTFRAMNFAFVKN